MGSQLPITSSRDLGRIRDPRQQLDATLEALDRLRVEQARVRRLRDEAIVRLCDRGMTYQAIASAAGLTRGRVAQIMQRAAERSRQV